MSKSDEDVMKFHVNRENRTHVHSDGGAFRAVADGDGDWVIEADIGPASLPAMVNLLSRLEDAFDEWWTSQVEANTGGSPAVSS